MSEILEERELSEAERSLTRWLLEHGQPQAADFLDQVERVRVISVRVRVRQHQFRSLREWLAQSWGREDPQ